MDKIKVTYKLKLLNGDNGNMAELIRAIDIYSKNTPVHEKTSSNDFIYWATHHKDYKDDNIFIFGFYKNDELVGFGELAYFSQEKILILDYLTLARNHSSNNVFFEFYSQIISFMHANSYNFDYIISEIPFVEEGKSPSSDEKLWIKMLEMQSFKEIKAKYIQPSLTDKNPETETHGILMVFQCHPTSAIRKDTLSVFLHTMYFKHYARWYGPRFTDQLDLKNYMDKLSSFKAIIEDSIEGDHVKLNGCPNIMPVTMPSSSTQHNHSLLSFVFPSIICMVICMAGFMFLWKTLDLSREQFSTVAFTTIVIFFLLLAVVSEHARTIAKELLGKLNFLTKHD